MKKEAVWQSKRQELQKVTDELDEPIDPGIIEAVVGLNLLGFHTKQSCEGHADRAVPAPWVMLSRPGQPAERRVGESELIEELASKHGLSVSELHEGINEAATEELEQRLGRQPERSEFVAWQATMREESKRLSKLLEEFDEEHQFPNEVRLQIEEGADYFRLHNGGEDFRKGLLDELSVDDRQGLPDRLKAYQTEMLAFTEFLKQKFMEGS